jgi:hypothetical protein
MTKEGRDVHAVYVASSWLQGLAKNSALRVLVLQRTGVEDRGAVALAAALGSNRFVGGLGLCRWHATGGLARRGVVLSGCSTAKQQVRYRAGAVLAVICSAATHLCLPGNVGPAVCR